MRIFAILCLCVALSMALIPFIAYNNAERGAEEELSAPPPEEETTAHAPPSEIFVDKEISVYLPRSDTVQTLSMRDYLIGAVSAEMPASYHPEALKAQALCCLTYAVRVSRAERERPTEGLRGASVSADSRVHQAYMTLSEMENRWGQDYEENYKKIAQAVDAVIDKIIVYDGRPILAVFHAMSPGRTESAENIWEGGGYPYLVPAVSEGDTLSPQFETTLILTEKQFYDVAQSIEGVKLGSRAADWAGKSEVSGSGTVLSIEIGGKKLTGPQVREFFNLRSPNFTLKYDEDGSFTFKVKGYGHGVGMSQYGADYMARQGVAYEEIIRHYYSGVEIVTSNK